MKSFKASALATLLISASSVMASTTALNVALPYNYFVLGNFSASLDLTGRLAVGGTLSSNGITVGSDIGNSADPYSLASNSISLYANSITGGGSDNIQKGNVYVAGSNNANFNFNGGGTKLSSCGTQCIDFAAATTTLQNYSTQLGGLAQNGTIGTDPQNPSRTLLNGSSSTLNVFNLTAAQFAGTLNIVTPSGSTTVVNVIGTGSITGPGGGLYINGNQASGTQSAGAGILFNFAQATGVNIASQFSASILAPRANYFGTAQVDGNVIVASVTASGETHDALFTGSGNLPAYTTATPEPSTAILFVGAGLLFAASRARHRVKHKLRCNL